MKLAILTSIRIRAILKAFAFARNAPRKVIREKTELTSGPKSHMGSCHTGASSPQLLHRSKIFIPERKLSRVRKT